MAGILRRGISWLGLGPDEDYDEYDEVGDHDDYDEYDDAAYVDDDPLVDDAGIRDRDHDGGRVVGAPTERVMSHLPGSTRQRPSRASRPAADEVADGPAAVRVISAPAATGSATAGGAQFSASAGRGSVRPVPSPVAARPHILSPESFNDAQEIGDRFKSSEPVIISLGGLDRDLARRLLDFSSGVTYALGGHVERVGQQVYLLTPLDVEVSAEDRRKIADALGE